MDPTQAKELLTALEAAGIPLPTQLSGSNLQHEEAVTPADGTDLTSVASGDYDAAIALYVGTSGDVVVTLKSGSDVTLEGMAAGVWHPRAPYTRVKATGTTASGLVAGY